MDTRWGHTGPCQPGCTCTLSQSVQNGFYNNPNQATCQYREQNLAERIQELNVRLDRLNASFEELLAFLKSE